MADTNDRLTKNERKELKKQERIENEQKEQKQAKMRQYINWGIGVAIVVGIILFAKAAMTPTGPTGPIEELTRIEADDWTKGASNSATLLVEYSDFQCPACASYNPIVERLIEEKGDKFTFVYRHFPLSQHKNAHLAARSSEAAGIQGKFWEMHKMLFENQTSWSEEDNAKEIFIGYAKELELNIDQFTTDIDSAAVKANVDSDYDSGMAVRVNSTPTFFLNGEKLESLRSYDEFAELLDKKIGEQPQITTPEAEPTVQPDSDKGQTP